MKNKRIYIFLLCALFSTSFVRANNAYLTIKIQNIEILEGNIRIGIFNSSEMFLKKGSTYSSYIINVKDTSETIIIDNLPKGEYAFMLYHDKNSDGKLNQNFIGIPKEAFGFSNNIKPKFSKPTFEECKFLLEKEQNMRVKLSYFK